MQQNLGRSSAQAQSAAANQAYVSAAAQTQEQDHQMEGDCANDIKRLMSEFLNFPTADNLDLVLHRTREYQKLWMTGRRRVL